MRVFVDPIKEAWEDQFGLPELPAAPDFDPTPVTDKVQELWDVYDSTLVMTDGDKTAAEQAADGVRRMRRKKE